MKEHICFKCKNSRKRQVANFIETSCDYFQETKQQVEGDVSCCEMFEHINIKGISATKDEVKFVKEQKKLRIVGERIAK